VTRGDGTLARIHDRRETFCSAAPVDVGVPPPPWADRATSAGNIRRGSVIGGLLRRLIPAEARIRRPRGTSPEAIVASLGAVEIHQVPTGCFVRTCANGEPAQARETALKRLTEYLDGNNIGAVRLDAERPVVLEQRGQRRWRISLRLSLPGDGLTAPTPCASKVKLEARETELFAVVRMAGHPDHDTIAWGDAIVLDALTASHWVAIGIPIIRLPASGFTRWFKPDFEIAVPVAPRQVTALIPGTCSA